MSHDFKKYKFLKKIIGLIGYKLVDKNYTKLERSLEKYTIDNNRLWVFTSYINFDRAKQEGLIEKIEKAGGKANFI